MPSSPSKSLPPIELTGWPVYRAPLAGRERPLVNFLFGGGVFRGVFHMGVMNGLNELGLMPDLVAGSSVGSILAAMIAQVFTEETTKRQIPIADLSATFLGIDQLVMTDRLADFVRGLTLRAADANFSARDLDLVLRRYNLDPGVRFGARGRRVVAGLERLFYLSPMHCPSWSRRPGRRTSASSKAFSRRRSRNSSTAAASARRSWAPSRSPSSSGRRSSAASTESPATPSSRPLPSTASSSSPPPPT